MDKNIQMAEIQVQEVEVDEAGRIIGQAREDPLRRNHFGGLEMVRDGVSRRSIVEVVDQRDQFANVAIEAVADGTDEGDNSAMYFDADGHLFVPYEEDMAATAAIDAMAFYDGGMDANDSATEVDSAQPWFDEVRINEGASCSWQTDGRGQVPELVAHLRRPNDQNDPDWDMDGYSSSDDEYVPVRLPRTAIELRDEEIPEEGYINEDVAGNEDEFLWTDDFATFGGTQEDFLEEAGPKIDGICPVDVFTQIFDRPLIEKIVHETNKYAREKIGAASETGIPPSPRMNDWVETTVFEVYRLITVIMIMGICVRQGIDEYWSTDLWSMPKFRGIMTRKRFELLMRYLHFTDSYEAPIDSECKIHKIKPILDYLNAKFKAVYTPRREISIDESLLLWKGHLSWVQCIRTKAARFGIKSYEMCEAVTGYVLTIILYAGKGNEDQKPLHGFTGATAKIVLKLMTDFLDKGYTLFMDNFYNSVPLTRYLKSRHTDVVGTLNRRRIGTPADIKSARDRVPIGTMISRHCGDVSVNCWKDNKLVTIVSTYHNADMSPGRLAGRQILKPDAVHTYNSIMGGMDLKNHKLSPHMFERKRCIKWYHKVFWCLLNISVLNSHIIHTSNVGEQGIMTKRRFRYRLIHELLNRFNRESEVRDLPLQRLSAKDVGHFPVTVDIQRERTKNQCKKKRGNCVRCTMLGRRTTVAYICDQCNVFLCFNACWKEYHTLENL